MAKFNFYLREKDKDSETPILLFVSYSGMRFKYPTGKTIHPKFWNEETQLARATNNFPFHKKFNATLKLIKFSAEKVLESLTAELKRIPSTDEVKKGLDLELQRTPDENLVTDDNITFLQLFKRFIDESENGLRLTTNGKRFDNRSIQKYNTVYDVVSKFGKSYNLTFESIDNNFYTKFVDHLNRKKFSLNNVGKYIQVIKTFLNYATENGYNTNMFYKTKQFKAHKVAGFSIYLNESEIEAIYKHDFSDKPALERVRDLFIVGCWTGLRFSDFSNIKPENIEEDYLKIKTFKTGEKVIIPIHYTVKEIMKKYEGKYPNSLPPAITNQKMNEYLKTIAKEIKCLKVNVETEGIKGGLKVSGNKQKWELVTTHTARRSFATNVYKSGFPAISLMKITGHKTEKSFLLYIKVTPEENAHKLMDHWRNTALKVV